MLTETKNVVEDNYETRESSISSISLALEETLRAQVFLRIRPTQTYSENQNFNGIYTVEDSSTVFVKPFWPTDAARRSMVTKSSDVPKKKFSFTKVFTPEVDQAQFFTEAIKPSIIDFLNNQNTNVITYGAADAGKTYSLFGSASNLGIIPRSIEFIYSSLICTNEPHYKPQRFSAVTNVDESARLLEMEAKEKLLSCRVVDKTACEEAYHNLENSEHNKNREILNDSTYSVWISFVEIYNDTIYDLLEVDDEGKNMQLKIATDKHGSTYIHGMRSVCATTGLEAYEILNAGQTRLSTVSTSNYKSSRSHSIFTIKLLKYDKDSEASEVKVSTISFCDLAGSGRIQKVVQNEKQLKESRSINISLLALGRCLKVMHDGHSRYSTGPFRDSKLTRLFQRPLCGKENLILLININPSLDLFAETLNVLNFASSAMKLTSEKEDKKLLEFQTPLSSPKSREYSSSSNLKITPNQDITEIVFKNEQLLNELKDIKTVMLKREFEIRQELADKFTMQLSDLDETWKVRMLALQEEKDAILKCSVSRIESFYKEKLDECSKRKRKKIDRGDYVDIGDIEELEQQYSSVSSDLEYYKSSFENMKLKNTELKAQKNQYAFELALVKEKLQKIVESTSNPFNEAVIEQLDFDTSDADNNDTNNSFDQELVSYISIIQKFIKKSFKLQKKLEQRKMSNAKEVQCEFNFNVVDELCKEIQELVEPRIVNLPEIESSLDDSLEVHDQKDHNNISITLSNVKALIIDNLTKINKLEMEINNKNDELRVLQNNLEQQQMETVQMSLQYQESETRRLSISKKFDNFKANLQFKETMDNYNVHMVETDSLNFIEDPSMSINSSRNESRLSLFESDFDKNESAENRYSSESNKNDSGLASSIESAVKINEHKSCQTNTEEEKSNSFQDRLWQLTLDYKEMKAQHLQESQRVNDLSQELEYLSDEMSKVKENTSLKERTIAEYKGKLSSNQLEIERLSNEKDRLEKRCYDLTKELGDIKTEYEKKLTESQVKLKYYEEGENKTAKCLEDYWKKSLNLGSELSDAYLKLEKTSNQCFKEHILKIEMLEKELKEKKLNQDDLEKKLTMYEKDFVETNDLSDKVNNFEILVNRIQQEKCDLRRILSERTKCQTEIENQLQKLVLKVEDRDNQIVSLKVELNTVIKTNLSNSRKAKELGRDVARLMEKVCYVKESFVESETALKNLERSSNKEISNLRARLTIFEENAEILNSICDNHENKQSEIDKLKYRLLEREKELEFFKRNRKATIQRYEFLVRQLQDALKMHNHSSKLKKIFCHKQKYFLTNSKECLHCDLRGSEPQMSNWKTFHEDDAYLLASRNSHGITESASVCSTELPFSKEEPSRLSKKSSEKSLQSEKSRALVKIQHVPCKDVMLDCDSTSFLNDCLSIDRTDSPSKYHSNTKRSYKEYY